MEINQYIELNPKVFTYRFTDKVIVNPATGCWEWQASKNTRSGYGQYWDDDRQTVVGAHVYAYECAFGPVPEGKELGHTCEGRCVNPSHVRPITHTENLQEGRVGENNRLKTHCPKNHEYTDDNTFYDVHNRRRCCTCYPLKPRPRRQL